MELILHLFCSISVLGFCVSVAAIVLRSFQQAYERREMRQRRQAMHDQLICYFCGLESKLPMPCSVRLEGTIIGTMTVPACWVCRKRAWQQGRKVSHAFPRKPAA